MRTITFTICTAIALAGCATPEQQAAQKEREMEQMIRVYGPACEKLGYPKNADAWRNCILTLNTNDERRQARPYYGVHLNYFHGF